MNFKKRILLYITLLVTNLSFAKNNSDSAIVVVSFVVNKEGQKEKIKVHDIVCTNCTTNFKDRIKEDAVNIIKNSPNYLPQKKKQKFLQPVKFRIESN